MWRAGGACRVSHGPARCQLRSMSSLLHARFKCAGMEYMQCVHTSRCAGMERAHTGCSHITVCWHVLGTCRVFTINSVLAWSGTC
eukprot:350247-Chlamydomonas_euryale.AAC.3